MANKNQIAKIAKNIDKEKCLETGNIVLKAITAIGRLWSKK